MGFEGGWTGIARQFSGGAEVPSLVEDFGQFSGGQQRLYLETTASRERKGRASVFRPGGIYIRY